MIPESGSVAAWLRRLEFDRLIVLSPRMLIEVEELLRHWRSDEKPDMNELACGLASLLAKDETRWNQIFEQFQASFANNPPMPPWYGQWIHLRPKNAWAVVFLGAFALGIALGFGIFRWMEPVEKPKIELDAGATVVAATPVELPPLPTSSAGPSPFEPLPLEIVQPEEKHLTTISSPPSALSPQWTTIVLAIFTALLALLGARLLFAPAEVRADRKEILRRSKQERDRLMQQGGAPGLLYHIQRVPPMLLSAIDDAATLLGRITRREQGHELDVPATIDYTIQAGGRIVPVHAPGRRPMALVVLVDIEDGDHPYLDGVNWVLDRWQRMGVSIVRYNYKERPVELRSHPEGQHISLEALARRMDDAPFLVFSRMVMPQDYGSSMPWLRRLKAWENRAWIDLDPRLRHERGRNARRLMDHIAQEISRYPFTREGLMACVTALATRGQKRRTPVERSLLKHTPDIQEALQLWAAAACCVPDPGWPQLDALRRELPEIHTKLPESRYVQRLLDWVRCQGMGEGEVGRGGHFRLTDRARRELRQWLRVYDAIHFKGQDKERRVENRARMLLKRQLEAAQVGEDAFDQKMRDMKKAVHEAVLDPSKIPQLIKDFEASGVAPEFFDLLAEEWDLQCDKELEAPSGTKWTRNVRELVERFVKGCEGVWLGDIWSIWRWNLSQGYGGILLLLWVAWSWQFWYWENRRIAAETETVSIVLPATHRVVVPDQKSGEPKPKGPEKSEMVALADVAPMHFIRLPGGKFMMGSPESEKDRGSDERQHPAEVAAFEIAIHEVTQKQWKTVMGTETFICEYGCKDELPANGVSWEEALRFMNALTYFDNKARSSDKKLTHCYRAEKRTWDRKCTGYRLPTEVEWEYAARAGTETAYSFGEDAKELCKYGNVLKSAGCDDGFKNLAPVGTFKPNPWGLYDIHGNVWEWVWDLYGDYPLSSSLGYAGVKDGEKYDDSERRVFRGGSFVNGSSWVRSSDRGGDRPRFGHEIQGFRCVRASTTQP